MSKGNQFAEINASDLLESKMKKALAMISVTAEKVTAWVNRLDRKGERIKQLNQHAALHLAKHH